MSWYGSCEDGRRMADVSNRLRAARERAGLTIQDISATTKIKVSQLQALENGHFEQLPGEFFTRAFIKTYARELGLPAEEIVREYDASRRGPEPATEPPRVAAAPPPSPALEAQAGPREHQEADGSSPLLRALSPERVWAAVAFAVLVLLVLVLVNREPQRAAESGAVNAAGGAPERSAQPAATSGTAEKRPETLSMEIAPTAEIWINASADGQRAIYRLVKPGERLKVEARNELSFRIGNAAAFQYSINGVPGRVLGQSGEVLEFQVTRDNLGTYHR